jgi:hypothetical protein
VTPRNRFLFGKTSEDLKPKVVNSNHNINRFPHQMNEQLSKGSGKPDTQVEPKPGKHRPASKSPQRVLNCKETSGRHVQPFSTKYGPGEDSDDTLDLPKSKSIPKGPSKNSRKEKTKEINSLMEKTRATEEHSLSRLVSPIKREVAGTSRLGSPKNMMKMRKPKEAADSQLVAKPKNRKEKENKPIEQNKKKSIKNFSKTLILSKRKENNPGILISKLESDSRSEIFNKQKVDFYAKLLRNEGQIDKHHLSNHLLNFKKPKSKKAKEITLNISNLEKTKQRNLSETFVLGHSKRKSKGESKLFKSKKENKNTKEKNGYSSEPQYNFEEILKSKQHFEEKCAQLEREREKMKAKMDKLKQDLDKKVSKKHTPKDSQGFTKSKSIHSDSSEEPKSPKERMSLMDILHAASILIQKNVRGFLTRLKLKKYLRSLLKRDQQHIPDKCYVKIKPQESYQDSEEYNGRKFRLAKDNRLKTELERLSDSSDSQGLNDGYMAQYSGQDYEEVGERDQYGISNENFNFDISPRKSQSFQSQTPMFRKFIENDYTIEPPIQKYMEGPSSKKKGTDAQHSLMISRDPTLPTPEGERKTLKVSNGRTPEVEIYKLSKTGLLVKNTSVQATSPSLSQEGFRNPVQSPDNAGSGKKVFGTDIPRLEMKYTEDLESGVTGRRKSGSRHEKNEQMGEAGKTSILAEGPLLTKSKSRLQLETFAKEEYKKWNQVDILLHKMNSNMSLKESNEITKIFQILGELASQSKYNLKKNFAFEESLKSLSKLESQTSKSGIRMESGFVSPAYKGAEELAFRKRKIKSLIDPQLISSDNLRSKVAVSESEDQFDSQNWKEGIKPRKERLVIIKPNDSEKWVSKNSGSRKEPSENKDSQKNEAGKEIRSSLLFEEFDDKLSKRMIQEGRLLSSSVRMSGKDLNADPTLSMMKTLLINKSGPNSTKSLKKYKSQESFSSNPQIDHEPIEVKELVKMASEHETLNILQKTKSKKSLASLLGKEESEREILKDTNREESQMENDEISAEKQQKWKKAEALKLPGRFGSDETLPRQSSEPEKTLTRSKKQLNKLEPVNAPKIIDSGKSSCVEKEEVLKSNLEINEALQCIIEDLEVAEGLGPGNSIVSSEESKADRNEMDDLLMVSTPMRRSFEPRFEVDSPGSRNALDKELSLLDEKDEKSEERSVSQEENYFKLASPEKAMEAIEAELLEGLAKDLWRDTKDLKLMSKWLKRGATKLIEQPQVGEKSVGEKVGEGLAKQKGIEEKFKEIDEIVMKEDREVAEAQGKEKGARSHEKDIKVRNSILDGNDFEDEKETSKHTSEEETVYGIRTNFNAVNEYLNLLMKFLKERYLDLGIPNNKNRPGLIVTKAHKLGEELRDLKENNKAVKDCVIPKRVKKDKSRVKCFQFEVGPWYLIRHNYFLELEDDILVSWNVTSSRTTGI